MNVAAPSRAFEIDRRSSVETRSALVREVRRGLLGRPRSLAPWMLYDARGSKLFERITTLHEYYPARLERNIFKSFSDAIVRVARAGRPEPLRVVELGAGSASKTVILLDATVRMQGDVLYKPVDIIGRPRRGLRSNCSLMAPGECRAYRGELCLVSTADRTHNRTHSRHVHRLEHREFRAKGGASDPSKSGLSTASRRCTAVRHRHGQRRTDPGGGL